MWVGVAVLVLVAGASVAYFRRERQPAPQPAADSSTLVTKNDAPPQPERSESAATPIPPTVPHGSAEAPSTQAKAAPSKIGGDVPPVHQTQRTSVPTNVMSGGATKPASNPSPTTATPPPSSASAGSQKPATAAPQTSSPPSTQPANTSTPAPPTNSTPTANPATTQPGATTPANTGTSPGNMSPGTETVAVYHVGGGVSAPSIVSARQPDYTDEASRVHKEGKVVLSTDCGYRRTG